MIPLLLAAGLAQADQVYALNLRVASSASLPLFGRAVTFTDSLALLRTEAAPGGLLARQEVCGVRIDDPLPIADTSIPPAFVRALGERQFRVAVDPQAAGASWVADLGEERVGYAPGPDGLLPRAADAPGVFDWDGDGQPGASVLVHVRLFGAVPVYVVQRAHTRLRGTLGADGAVEGQVELLAFEQQVIGAAHPLFHASPELVWRPEQSRFRAEPVGADTTCADLIAGRVPAPALPAR